MAFVVRRPRGRWEIRESFSTPAGPRSRTLASFFLLTPDSLAKAAGAARTPLDEDSIVRSARRAGAPVAPKPIDGHAEALLRDLARGDRLRPGLRRLLAEHLDDSGPAASVLDDSLTEWLGATLDERGSALVELLGLADRLPQRHRPDLEFPGLSRERLQA